jgi:hypothetical protein
MKTYSNLQELYNDSKPHQITAQEILNGRTYINGQWQEITLSPDFRREICETLSELYGGRQTTKNRVYRNLLNERRQHWGLGRTVVCDYGSGAHWSYIAGQDQQWESNEIRKALK